MKYWVRPNMVKFIELINTEDKKVIKNIASYIYNAFEIRNNIMYNNSYRIKLFTLSIFPGDKMLSHNIYL